MTTRTDCTPLEWEQLKRLPWLVAGGVLELCQTSWIGKLRGSLALLAAYRNSARQFPNTPLVQDLLNWSASLPRGTRPAPPPPPGTLNR